MNLTKENVRSVSAIGLLWSALVLITTIVLERSEGSSVFTATIGSSAGIVMGICCGVFLTTCLLPERDG